MSEQAASRGQGTLSRAELSAQMQARLQVLAPQSLDIDDQSALHAGHPGAAGGGGHYRLAMTSTAFAGLTRIQRHRLVYATLGDLMHRHIHALAIVARAPGEQAIADGVSTESEHPSKGVNE
jgi:BolA protein